MRSQYRLGECVELQDCSARDAEDLATAPPKRDPGLERDHALGAEAFKQRIRQVGGQCMRHIGQSSQFGSFAKRDLTSCGTGASFSDAFRRKVHAALVEARPVEG